MNINLRPLYLQRILILLLVCYVFFLFGNSFISLTDPDEAFYSLTAKEMIQRHDWLTPYIFDQPQFEKPILTYWLIAVAFKVWGVTPFAARFFPAIFASLGVLAVYFLGLLGFKEERKAFLSALVLATSALFVGMGKTVFTDMIFTVFILLAFVSFFWAMTDDRRRALGFIGFYIFCALATLTKGPLGFVMPQLAVILFLLYQRQMQVLRNIWIPVGFFVFLVIALPWYWWMVKLHGDVFIQEFFYNDHWRRLLEAEHKGNDHWFFYPLTMIVGVFPWSLFLLVSWKDLFHRLRIGAFVMDYFCLAWILVVFVVFQLAHSKLTSYILPLFPALALMTGNFLDEGIEQVHRQKRMKILICISFGFLALLGIGFIFADDLIKKYLSSDQPIYFLSGGLIALSGIGFVLAFKERLQSSIYLLAGALLPILLSAFMMSADLEGFISSWQVSQYLPHQSASTTMILTSKVNARGIRFYTGQDVAVVNLGSKAFFSPHPIPMLNTQEDILNVIKNQPVTYAVLRKNGYEYLTQNFKDTFNIVIVKKFGLDFLLKVQPLQQT